jgi:hypothetical protein
MKESDWLAATDPRPMLSFLADRASERKFRLFSIACCRRIWPMLVHESSRRCVEVAERYCFGLATLAEMQSVVESARQDPHQRWGGPLEWWAGLAAADAAELTCFVIEPGDDGPSVYAQRAAEDVIRAIADDRAYLGSPYFSAPGTPESSDWAALCPVLREIVGNPFVQVDWEARWRTKPVCLLGEDIVMHQAFDRMPHLGDALVEAGCANEAILDHCRQGGGHLCGCWVVDLALGLE